MDMDIREISPLNRLDVLSNCRHKHYVYDILTELRGIFHL